MFRITSLRFSYDSVSACYHRWFKASEGSEGDPPVTQDHPWRELLAIEDVRVPVGSVLIIRGANGAGKSTLLRLCAGLLTPQQGTISWCGVPVAQCHVSCISYLPSRLEFEPDSSVQETYDFHTLLRGEKPAGVGPNGVRHLPTMAALSEGQRWRLFLKQHVEARRPVWLLDEPVAHLDQQGQEELITNLRWHLAGGGVALIATQDDHWVKALASVLEPDKTLADTANLPSSGALSSLPPISTLWLYQIRKLA